MQPVSEIPVAASVEVTCRPWLVRRMESAVVFEMPEVQSLEFWAQFVTSAKHSEKLSASELIGYIGKTASNIQT